MFAIGESDASFSASSITTSGRARERASGIGAEARLAAALGIAVARGCMSTTSYVPDAVFR